MQDGREPDPDYFVLSESLCDAGEKYLDSIGTLTEAIISCQLMMLTLARSSLGLVLCI